MCTHIYQCDCFVSCWATNWSSGEQYPTHTNYSIHTPDTIGLHCIIPSSYSWPFLWFWVACAWQTHLRWGRVTISLNSSDTPLGYKNRSFFSSGGPGTTTTTIFWFSLRWFCWCWCWSCGCCPSSWCSCVVSGRPTIMQRNYTCTDIEQQEAPKVWRHTNHYKFRYCHSYACTFMLFLICWL